jgi:hypothetical protein
MLLANFRLGRKNTECNLEARISQAGRQNRRRGWEIHEGRESVGDACEREACE